MNHATVLQGAVLAFGIALAGGAIGVGVGDGLAGSAAMAAMARQPEAGGRIQLIMWLVFGLAEGAYFINLALGFYLITSLAQTVSG